MRVNNKKAVAALAVVLAMALPCAAAFAAGATPAADGQKPAAEAAETAKPGPSEELLAWAAERDCASCHEVQAQSTEDKELGANLHTLMKLDCTGCHADDALIDIHEKAKPDAKAPTKLKKSKLAVDVCATCHVPDKLAEKTADCTALTDSEGTVVNPHQVPEVKDHKSISCQSCHKMHSESKPTAIAPTLCADCHHEDVYECYTCHS